MCDLIAVDLANCQLFNAAIITTGAVSPFAEMPDWLNEMLGLLYGAEGIVSEVSGQALALFLTFLAPVVIIVVVVLAKIAYDIFTGTADSVGDAILIIRLKVKAFIVSKLSSDK